MRLTEIYQYRASSAAPRPLYASRPAAGFPAPGDDVVERPLDLNDYLITHQDATFFVRVEGESMEGAGIFSGDVLVVDRSLQPASGEVVVAAVYGELVVKRFFIGAGKAELRSEHASYAPILINDADDCFIWGVVVGSVRKFR